MGNFELPINIEKSTDKQERELGVKFEELFNERKPNKETATAFSRLGRDYEKIRNEDRARKCFLSAAEILQGLEEHHEAGFMFEKAGEDEMAKIEQALEDEK